MFFFFFIEWSGECGSFLSRAQLRSLFLFFLEKIIFYASRHWCIVIFWVFNFIIIKQTYEHGMSDSIINKLFFYSYVSTCSDDWFDISKRMCLIKTNFKKNCLIITLLLIFVCEILCCTFPSIITISKYI